MLTPLATKDDDQQQQCMNSYAYTPSHFYCYPTPDVSSEINRSISNYENHFYSIFPSDPPTRPIHCADDHLPHSSTPSYYRTHYPVHESISSSFYNARSTETQLTPLYDYESPAPPNVFVPNPVANYLLSPVNTAQCYPNGYQLIRVSNAGCANGDRASLVHMTCSRPRIVHVNLAQS
jgi:hypothetical protein